TAYYTGGMERGIVLAGPDREVPAKARVLAMFARPMAVLGWVLLTFGSFIVRPGLEHLGPTTPLPAILTALALPTSGLLLVLWQAFLGLRAVRLLRRGIPTVGHLVGSRKLERGDEGPMELSFEFKTVDGRTARCTARTYRAGELMDDPQEELVYDPSDPSVAALLDEIPGRPRLTEAGVRLTDGSWVWPWLLLPGLFVFVHIVWTWAKR
ncbi:MAG: Uncharacterized protein FD126_3268, partial [Elusimicrobia bacterium]